MDLVVSVVLADLVVHFVLIKLVKAEMVGLVELVETVAMEAIHITVIQCKWLYRETHYG